MPHSAPNLQNPQQNQPKTLLWVVVGLVILAAVIIIAFTDLFPLTDRETIIEEGTQEMMIPDTEEPEEFQIETEETQPGLNEDEAAAPQEIPSLTEETMDRPLSLSCAEGIEVVLLDQPRSAEGESLSTARVRCETEARAFNKYYHEETNTTWYAVEIIDETEAGHGWVAEDLIIWLE